MKPLYSGIIPPMITPLTARDTLDISGLEKLVERLVEGGVSGIFALGTTGEALTVELSNAGERPLRLAPLRLEGEAADELALLSDACGGREIPAAGRCGVEITFTPSATGSRLAALVIDGEAANLARRLPLLGQGVAPQLVASPLTVSFGEVLVGERGRRATIDLENRGTAKNGLGQVRIGGPQAGDFDLVGDACSGRILEPGERCSVALSFLPSGSGDRRAELRLGDGGDGGLVETPKLSGRGQAAQARLTADPESLAFEPRLVGTASPPRGVTFENGGNGPLRLAGLELEPGGSAAASFLLDRGDCQAGSLPPGGSCTATLRYRPVAEGDAEATLVATSDAGVRRIPLRGAGTVPEIFVDPLVLEVSGVAPGSVSEPKFVKVASSGSGPLVIEEIRLRGAGAQAFTARPVGCTAKPLAPKTSCGIEVRFEPRRPGSFQAEVEIRHNAAGSPHRLKLRGGSGS